MSALLGFILGIVVGIFVVKRDFTLNINKTVDHVVPETQVLTQEDIDALIGKTDSEDKSNLADLNGPGFMEAIASITQGIGDLVGGDNDE